MAASSSSSPTTPTWDEDHNVLEWETNGFWEKSVALRPCGYRIVFTEVKESSAPYMHFKRLNLYDQEGNQFSYQAHSTALLKKSVHQSEELAQSQTEGKYRASRITEVPVTRTKWAPVKPTDGAPVILEITPPPGETSLPFLGSYEYVHGIRTSRYPYSWEILELHGSTTALVHKVEQHRVNGVDFNIENRITMTGEVQRSSFKGSERLFTTIASKNEEECIRALNCGMGPYWKNGHCTNSEEIMQAVVATGSPRLLCVFTSALQHHSPAIEKAVFASGNDGLIQAFVRAQPAKLGFFKAALLQKSDQLFDFLADLYADMLRDEDNANRIVAWSAQNSQLLSHVLKKLADLKDGASKNTDLPLHPVVADPTVRLLCASYLGTDRDLFNILFNLASKSTVAAFLTKMTEKNAITVELVTRAIDRGVHAANILATALETKNRELCDLLLSSGYSVEAGNDAALVEAFEKGNGDIFDILVSFGTPAPYFHLFNSLAIKKAEPDSSPINYAAALAMLFKPGRLTPDTVTPGGVSLLARAIKLGNFDLVAALLSAGANKQLPSGESVFSLIVSSTSNPDVLLSVLDTHSPGEEEIVSRALVKYVQLRNSNDIDAIKQFVAAGADINAIFAEQSVLTAAVTKLWDRAFFDGLLALGANASKSPSLAAAAAASTGQTFSSEDFEFLAGLQEFDAPSILFSVLLSRPSAVDDAASKTIVETAISRLTALDVVKRLPYKRMTSLHDHELAWTAQSSSCAKCAAASDSVQTLWSCSSDSYNLCTACVTSTQLVPSSPDAEPEIPLLLASLFFQSDNKLFLRLLEAGVRLPESFADVKAPVHLRAAFVLAVLNGEQLSADQISSIFDRFDHPSITREEYVGALLDPSAALAGVSTHTIDVSIFKALPETIFIETIDREDFDANFVFEDASGTFITKAIKARATQQFIELLLRQGASHETAENHVHDGKRVGSLIALATETYIAGFSSSSDEIKPHLIIKALLEAGFPWQSLDPENMPAPHAIALFSGSVSDANKRREIKRILLQLLSAGMPINHPLGDAASVKRSLASYCNFDGATPMDMNYAGNEYLQRWFRKRDGSRGSR